MSNSKSYRLLYQYSIKSFSLINDSDVLKKVQSEKEVSFQINVNILYFI